MVERWKKNPNPKKRKGGKLRQTLRRNGGKLPQILKTKNIRRKKKIDSQFPPPDKMF